MKKYKVIKPITIPCGVVCLTKEQATPRLEMIKHVKGDTYDVLLPIMFKSGELIGVENATKADCLRLEEIKPVKKGDK